MVTDKPKTKVTKARVVKTTDLEKKFNLYDIMTIEKPSKAVTKADKEDVSKFTEQLETARGIYDLYNSNGIQDDFQENDVLMGTLINNANKVREDYFLRNHKLHPDMMSEIKRFEKPWRHEAKELTVISSEDSLTKLDKTPTIKLGNIKSLADDLGMIVFPFDYIDERSYSGEGYELRRNLRNFSETLQDKFDLMVLAPINHYSLIKHVNSEDPNKQIYAGQHSMIFTSVQMNIPMFRSILNDLSDVREAVEGLSSTITNVEKNMKMMQSQLSSLQKQADQQRQQMLAQESAIKSLNSKLAEMEFRATDPVIFAVPKGTDINNMDEDNNQGFVGPVWGEDFQGIALYKLGVQIVENQRNQLNQIVSKVW